MSDKYGIRGVVRGPKPAPKTDLMPLPEAMQIARESMSAWVTKEMALMRKEHEKRVKRIKAGKEHPMPFCSELVKRWAGLGASREQVARLCGVSWRTISEYYDDDYELGVVQFNMPVAANLWRIARSETDPQAANAAMKWLERRGGENWKPPRLEVKTEHTQEKPLIDSSRLTFEDRAALRQMLTRLDEEGAVPAVTQEDGQ